ncbi:MAG: T9SS type A sorting domain-containing protein [Bacteroidales bacterium]|nr:T9SS type A sorting domain-containing protein [Bacteroidales bacterium]
MNKTAIRLVLLILLLIPLSIYKVSGAISDTSYHFLFELNMTKAIQDGFFDPDSDQVYVDFDESIPDLLLFEGSDRVFSGLIQEGLDSGATYHFRFRVNDTVFESVNREAVALPGVTVIQTWWNDEYLNTTIFQLSFTGIPDSVFNPLLDTVQMMGDMTKWEAVELERIGTSYDYDITFHLDPSILYEYIFRIKRDSVITYEDFGGLSRMFLPPPDTTITVVQYFNNQDTTKILMTFECNMTMQEQLGNFDPSSDFLDVAGNFNEWGAWDLLFDPYNTGLYTLSKLFDKSLIGGPPIEFKFRINGSWDSAELDSLDPRSYILQPIDTNGNPNTYVCWYNNQGPIIPSSPWASDLFIQGLLEVKQILTGSYLYHNLSGIPEGTSLYKWYRADSVGAVLEAIDSAWTINYTTDSIADLGKYLVFEVTPVAAYGEDSLGLPVQVYTTGPIGNVGIPEWLRNTISLYPNPADQFIICESAFSIDRYEIYNLSGQPVLQSGKVAGTEIQVEISQLPPGIYLFRVYTEGLLPGNKRFIKR